MHRGIRIEVEKKKQAWKRFLKTNSIGDKEM